ncbi:MAG TPA: 50S ribosomal protein L15 [Anaerolineales bacterium]|nr:50S ribosomal protein L15 [Anaerolineales bacterium]
MKLNDLQPNPGSKKDRKRVGRGTASGKGKTAGRGTKGQNSRAGSGGHLYRQGGNLPYFRRLPFLRGYGFTPPNQVEYFEVNLEQLKDFEANTEITPESLVEANLVRNLRKPIAILGKGEVLNPLKLRVHRITKSAREKIEAAGGSVELIA